MSSVCPICDVVIKETVGRRQSDDAVECSGTCATWVHRKCAGLSKVVYNEISKSEKPFYCPQCRFDQQELEIRSLRELVGALGNEIDALKKKVASLKEEVVVEASSLPVNIRSSPQKSYAQSVGVLPTSMSSHKPIHSESSHLEIPQAGRRLDRKCNLVLFGIKECSSGMQRLERSLNDMEEVSSILCDLNSNFNSNSIVDCHRLGKYNPESIRPRPILAKLCRPLDVQYILSRKNHLSGSVSIKADLPKEEREIENLLPKERWSLISTGSDRRDIKIRQSKILMKGKVHAWVDNHKLVLATPLVENSIGGARADSSDEGARGDSTHDGVTSNTIHSAVDGASDSQVPVCGPTESSVDSVDGPSPLAPFPGQVTSLDSVQSDDVIPGSSSREVQIRNPTPNPSNDSN